MAYDNKFWIVMSPQDYPFDRFATLDSAKDKLSKFLSNSGESPKDFLIFECVGGSQTVSQRSDIVFPAL